MNVARVNDATLQDLIAQGISTEEGDVRNAIYTQAEKYIADLAVWLPAQGRIETLLRPSNVTGSRNKAAAFFHTCHRYNLDTIQL